MRGWGWRRAASELRAGRCLLAGSGTLSGVGELSACPGGRKAGLLVPAPGAHDSLLSHPLGKMRKLHPEIPLHSGLPAGGETGLGTIPSLFHLLSVLLRCSIPGAQLCLPRHGELEWHGLLTFPDGGQDAWAQVCPEQTSLRFAPEGLGPCGPGPRPALPLLIGFICLSLSLPFCYPACLCHPLIPSLSVCLSVCLLPVPISRTPPRRAVSTDLAIPFPGAVLIRVPRKSRFALNFLILRSSTREKEMAVGARGGAWIRFQGQRQGWDLDEASEAKGQKKGKGERAGVRGASIRSYGHALRKRGWGGERPRDDTISQAQGQLCPSLWGCGGQSPFPGSNLLRSMALWPSPFLTFRFPLTSAPACAGPLLASPPRRYLTAAPVSSAHCVNHARGGWAGCVRATGSARTGSWAMGSAAARRAFTEQPVRCASWVATGPTAPEVRTGRGQGWWATWQRMAVMETPRQRQDGGNA